MRKINMRSDSVKNPNEYWSLYRQAKEGAVVIPETMTEETRKDYLKMLDAELRPLLVLREALMGARIEAKDYTYRSRN